MSITRRQFLTNVGVSLAASALVSTRAMSIGEVGQSDSNTLDDWAVVRDQFKLSPEYIHLATFALASHPRPVREAAACFSALAVATMLREPPIYDALKERTLALWRKKPG